MITEVRTPEAATKPQDLRAQARDVASKFEAMFVQQIVSKMRESSDFLGEGSMFGSGPGSRTYANWFDSYMSEHLAASGRVGVADELMRHLEELGQIPEPEGEST